MRRSGAIGLVLAFAIAAPASAVEIHAHRGGTLSEGALVAAENSLAAFQRAVSIGTDVVELDAKVTRDGVPVVMHDATLDRTTDCAGRVDAHTAAELESCRIDTLAGSPEPVPTLGAVLDWARDAGVRLNLEIKNVPTDPDFDVTHRFATRVLDALRASGIPPSQVLIQSFWPLNLDLAQLRGYETSLLTLGPLNEAGILYGAARLYDWVSPQWPPQDAALFTGLAHALGKKVVPYTLNTDAALAAAGAAGVDAVITDDPERAQRVLGQ